MDSIHVKDSSGETPFYRAAERGSVELLKLLLERNSDINTQDNVGKTPLYAAAEKGHTEAVRFLLIHGANTQLANHAGITPFAIATQKGHTDIAALLSGYNLLAHQPAEPQPTKEERYEREIRDILQNGVDIDERVNGVTGLCLAAVNGDVTSVKVLLEFGANPHLANNAGMTPLFCARSRHRDFAEVVALLEAKLNAEPSHTTTSSASVRP